MSDNVRTGSVAAVNYGIERDRRRAKGWRNGQRCEEEQEEGEGGKGCYHGQRRCTVIRDNEQILWGNCRILCDAARFTFWVYWYPRCRKSSCIRADFGIDDHILKRRARHAQTGGGGRLFTRVLRVKDKDGRWYNWSFWWGRAILRFKDYVTRACGWFRDLLRDSKCFNWKLYFSVVDECSSWWIIYRGPLMLIFGTLFERLGNFIMILLLIIVFIDYVCWL